MSAFEPDDTYNVLAEHFIETLQADTKLGTGGTLEIQTWEQELPEDVSEYGDHNLPAAAVSVEDGGGELNELSEHNQVDFSATILVSVGGGRLQNVLQLVKRIAARVERVMRQQNRPGKQLSDVTTDLEGACANTVKINGVYTEADAGSIENELRGAAEIRVEFSIDFVPPLD